MEKPLQKLLKLKLQAMKKQSPNTLAQTLKPRLAQTLKLNGSQQIPMTAIQESLPFT
jgi:hypothetical protein